MQLKATQCKQEVQRKNKIKIKNTNNANFICAYIC